MKVIFEGDFKSLKNKGFKLNKFYASNHIGYTFESSINSIIIWKAGRELTIGGIKKEQQSIIVNFLKEYKIEEKVYLKIEHNLATKISEEEKWDIEDFIKAKGIVNILNLVKNNKTKEDSYDLNENLIKHYKDKLDNNPTFFDHYIEAAASNKYTDNIELIFFEKEIVLKLNEILIDLK